MAKSCNVGEVIEKPTTKSHQIVTLFEEVKMKRKLVFLGLIIALIALPIAACAKEAPAPAPAPAPSPTPTKSPTPAPSPPSADVYRLTMGIISGTSQEYLAWNPPLYRYQNMVEELSGGRLLIDTKLDVMAAADLPVAVGDGRLDMTKWHQVLSSGIFPLWDYISLPFIFDTLYDYELALKDPRLNQLLDQSYAEEGLVRLAEFGCDGFTAVWSNEPLQTVDDFKGVKIRAIGLIGTTTMKSMGASPVEMFKGIGDALQKGTIDAAYTDRVFGFSQGLGDAASYLNRWMFGPTFGNAIVINKDKWEELPPDLQEVLREASQSIASQVFYATEFSGRFVEKVVSDAGLVEVIVPSDAERQKAIGMTRDVVAKAWVEKVGPEGQEILDILKDYFGAYNPEIGK